MDRKICRSDFDSDTAYMLAIIKNIENVQADMAKTMEKATVKIVTRINGHSESLARLSERIDFLEEKSLKMQKDFDDRLECLEGREV